MKKTILAFLSIWGWIILGTFASVLYHGSHLRSFLAVVAIPVFAAIIAATGPLAIIVCMLYLYRVQGGSFVAISSLIVGSALLYSVLIYILIFDRDCKCFFRKISLVQLWKRFLNFILIFKS